MSLGMLDGRRWDSWTTQVSGGVDAAENKAHTWTRLLRLAGSAGGSRGGPFVLVEAGKLKNELCNSKPISSRGATCGAK